MGCCQATTAAIVGKSRQKLGDDSEEVVLDGSAKFSNSAGSKKGVAPPAGSKAPRYLEQRGGLTPGTAVKIKGLTSDAAKRLNGELGILRSWDAATNRWKVQLKSSEVKDIRPENLEEVPGATKVPITIEVSPDEPPLLEVWNRERRPPDAAKAKVPSFLGGLNTDRPLAAYAEASAAAQAARGDDLSPLSPDNYDVDPDAQLLSLVDDERVQLQDLDADMQRGVWR